MEDQIITSKASTEKQLIAEAEKALDGNPQYNSYCYNFNPGDSTITLFWSYQGLESSEELDNDILDLFDLFSPEEPEQ